MGLSSGDYLLGTFLLVADRLIRLDDMIYSLHEKSSSHFHMRAKHLAFARILAGR